MEKIQIAVACSENTEPYLDLMLTTMAKTIDVERVQILLGVNSNRFNPDKVECLGDFDHKLIKAVGGSKGTQGHGYCLDVLFNEINSTYGMFIDSDVVFFSKDWLDKLIDTLTDKRVIVGTGYYGKTWPKKPHIYGKNKKYNHFPNVITCLFLTNVLKECDVLFRNNGCLSAIVPEELAHLIGFEKGETIICDTGWQLPVNLLKNGYEGVVMYKEPSPEWGIGAKCFYGLEGELMVAHIGRGSSKPFSRNEVQKFAKSVLNRIDELK